MILKNKYLIIIIKKNKFKNIKFITQKETSKSNKRLFIKRKLNHIIKLNNYFVHNAKATIVNKNINIKLYLLFNRKLLNIAQQIIQLIIITKQSNEQTTR